MSVALDVGTHELKSLRYDAEPLNARRCRAAYSVIDDVPHHRDVLERLGISFAVCEKRLLVPGDSAVNFEQLFRAPCETLFPAGALNAGDPLSRQIAATLVEALVGRATAEGELCALTLPADLKSGGNGTSPQREFFGRVVRLLGYTPLEVATPQALVLAELGNDAFTGIGLSFGAGSAQAGLMHRGNVLAACEVPFGGNWIDLRLARAQQLFVWDARGRKQLDTAKARHAKETFAGDVRRGETESELQLADLYRGMVEFLLREAAVTFGAVTKQMPIPGPLPMVVSGGSARVPGFRELLGDVLPTVSFPVQVADVRMAVSCPYTVTRGGLIRAELETVAETPAASAA
ncbi:MAG: hypothetical protein ACE5KM_01860 [Planctomycetaceae bacterium]